MNKKLKIVSSVALAGLLALNVFSPKTLAAEVADSVSTTPLKAYHKLVPNKSVVPFVLVNANDVVTVKEVVNNPEFTKVTKFNGTSIPSENTLVVTGDTFVADGKEYTVVVYGDVNKDGRVNGNDALLVQEAAAKMKTLDAVQLEAADVKNDESRNGNDALRIREFAARLSSSVIDKLPAAEADQSESSNFAVVMGENNKVGAPLKDAKIVVNLKSPVTTTTKFFVDLKDSKGTPLKNIELTNAMEKNYSYVENTIDLSTLKDGKVSGTLYSKEGSEAKKEVGTFSFEINTTLPAAANVKTLRYDTKKATVSLRAMGDSDLTKVYYMVTPTAITATTVTDVIFNKAIANVNGADVDKNGTFKIADGAYTKFVTLNISNNTLPETVIETYETMKEKTEYKLWYVLENSYGSRSNPVSVDIKTDEIAVDKVFPELLEVVAPATLSVATPEFTFVQDPSKDYKALTGYKVTVYKDGNPIKEDNTVAKEATAYAGLKDVIAELRVADKEIAGNYKISVVAKGTKANDSAEVMSKEVTVTALASVTNGEFAYDTKTKERILTWKDASNSLTEIADYEIKLLDVAKDDEVLATYTKSTDPVKVDLTNKQIKFTATQIAAGKLVKAQIVVKANANQFAKVDSEKFESKEFFVIPDGAVAINTARTTSDSVSVQLVKPIEISGKSTEYSIVVYRAVKGDTKYEDNYVQVKSIPNVVFDKIKSTDPLKEYVVNGLTAGETYSFELVVNVDGVTSKTSTASDVTILPEITGKKVLASTAADSDLTSETIRLNGTKLNVGTADAITIALGTQLENLKKAIDAGVAKPGDYITFKDNKLSIKVLGETSTRALGTAVKGMILEFEGNTHTTTITAADAGSEAKEVILKGNGAIFVATGTEVILPASSNVTLHGLKVQASDEVKIKETDANKFAVKYGNNTLTFENQKATPVEITVTGENEYTDKQQGVINLTENAAITLKADKASVESNLNYTVNTDSVNINLISDAFKAFTGNKTITLNNGIKTAGIVAKVSSDTVLPEGLAGKTLKLMAYDTAEDSVAELKTALGVEADKVTRDLIDEINSYLAMFNLVGNVSKDSTINFVETTDSNDVKTVTVTITVAEVTAEPSVKVGAIK